MAEIVTIPCRSDNYAFLLRVETSGRTVLIDAPEAGPILDALADRGWSLSDILITHHHQDHIDGVAELVLATGAKVWGNSADASRLPLLDHAVAAGDTIEIGSISFEVWDVPGHTIGHIAFVTEGAVFTADSLMALGCGRLFEGTPEMMWTSLRQFLDLPPQTLVCSGHEYTQGNARFALSVDPDNALLKARAAQIDADRAAGKPTVPSRLGDELATNPFLRPHLLKTTLGMQSADDVAVFAEIRARKDRF